MNENCLVIISWNIKKLKIGNNKVIEKIKICKLFLKILDKSLSGINPPEDMFVKAKLNESSSLKSTKLYKNITNIVDNE